MLQGLIELMLKEHPNERADIYQICKEVNKIKSSIESSDNSIKDDIIS